MLLNGLDQASIIAIFFILSIGLPHGAFDGAVAHYLGANKSMNSLIKFVSSYILMAILVIVLWAFFPDFSLAFFLLISAIHFGWGDANARRRLPFVIQMLAHGSLVIFGIVYFHPEEVSILFGLLTEEKFEFSMFLSEFLILLVPFLILLCCIFAIANTEMRIRCFELFALCGILASFPPLVGFAFYFCLIHTGRHMQNIFKVLKFSQSKQKVYFQAIIFTVLSWIFGGVALWYIDSGNYSIDLLRVTFVGLAALTVPHMILVDFFYRRKLREALE